MEMFQVDKSLRQSPWRVVLLSMVFVCGFGVVVMPQAVQLDVCGCKNNPASLGDFNTLDPSTYPAGTITAFRVLQIPVPADGVMVFRSMNLQFRPQDAGFLPITFIRNAANTPVTLLVSGNVTLGTNTQLNLSADAVVGASTNVLGKGSLGGPGGFRGGDAGYQLVNFARMGGAGSGPGGGAGGNDGYFQNGHGANATFVGATDLLPLLGGSGGGGGASISGAAGCGGGGGGGGGGALLIAADGTITINGQIIADGASGGSYGGDPNCSSNGGGGSGGAVRLLATTITGSGNVYARGGTGGVGPVANGAVRMEALNNEMTVGQTTPLSTRAAGPGPVVNPVTPTVALTTVGGQPVPSPPGGGAGAIDLVLLAPGPTPIAFSTTGVPTGTIVDVTVKPRVGGVPVTTPVTLGNCGANGTCLESVTFDLAAGAYFVEARATFTRP
jgi:hypothetical protein